ncbi:hypothetical protein NOF55_10710 [Rhizobiaceae bacterium BDR2-2]|uniref:Uncharacterized protein n=1 Tax=Ectorhizobium quercum TaxID=2965071 RepID=A0AAE3MYK7_9HYPH|nr:hypothetical protein [Ectorhizobium quercum]MCX8997578.1 hypothetical protein [Ectorhizobium quercum]
MDILSWSIIGVLLILLAFYSSRLAHNDDEGKNDIGLALLDFGRAFPNEAIRSLHFTNEGAAVFVRLFDNRAGFMRKVRGGHYACRLIAPGAVRVQPLENGRGFAVDFTDDPPYSGTFEFASAPEAAEVSLWLLENYVHPEDREEPAPSAERA